MYIKIYYLHPALLASVTLLGSYFSHSRKAALSAQKNPRPVTAQHGVNHKSAGNNIKVTVSRN